VILVNGRLGAWLARNERQLSVFLPDEEPARSTTARAVAHRLFDLATTADGPRRGLLVSEIDGLPAADHPLAPFLREAGFVAGAMGFQGSRRQGSRGSSGSRGSTGSERSGGSRGSEGLGGSEASTGVNESDGSDSDDDD
jgi:hypothetical protein